MLSPSHIINVVTMTCFYYKGSASVIILPCNLDYHYDILFHGNRNTVLKIVNIRHFYFFTFLLVYS